MRIQRHQHGYRTLGSGRKLLPDLSHTVRVRGFLKMIVTYL